MVYETTKAPEEILLESGVISKPEQNLRSKIESILRALQNLSEKQKRLEFEIRRQKSSLERKRQELKRSHKSLANKTKSVAETANPENFLELRKVLQEVLRWDSIALQETDRILNQN